MAEANFNDLVKVLYSSKAVFFRENAHLPDIEIQRLWKQRWETISDCVDGTSGKITPCKRSIPRTLSGDGYPPPKRQELVGPPCPRPPLLGLTGFPEPIISSP